VLASLFSEYARILVQSAIFLLTTLLKLLHLKIAALIISSAAVTCGGSPQMCMTYFAFSDIVRVLSKPHTNLICISRRIDVGIGSLVDFFKHFIPASYSVAFLEKRSGPYRTKESS
jgi:hypothetical protein